MVATADEILAQHAEADFEVGFAHARQRIRETHGRIVGATLDALVVGAVSTLGVRSRMRQDVRELVALAHRAAKGEDPRKLGEEHIDSILRLKSKMHLIAREDHPDFQPIMALAEGLFAKRLPDLARLVAVKEAATYDDIVRQAFPERTHVDAMVDDNAQAVAAMIEHLEKHPHVLRMPSSLTPKMAAMAREFIDWKVAEVRRGVDEIYGPK